MAREVFVPKLGQTVEEVTLVRWLVADGARVEQGQEILEVETDKAVFAVEAPARGTIHIGPFPEGKVVPVLTVVAVVGKPDEQFASGTVGEATPTAAEAKAAAEAATATAGAMPPAIPAPVFASPRARMLAAEKGVDLAAAGIRPTGGGGVRIAERDVLTYLASTPAAPKATPLAGRIAAETGVDLRTVAGTGPGGRITREDVEQAAVQRSRPREERAGFGAEETPRPTAIAPQPAAQPRPLLPEAEVTERIPLKGVRAIIAERMGTSVHTTARVTLVSNVDATELVVLRERLKAKVEKEWGFAPGYNDLLARIVALALRRFPYMNARLAPDAVELLAHVNLGMAVDTERGLLVPVIRDADTKSLRQFGAEFRELVDRARKGRSLPDDLTGGTFTITNLGMHEIDAFTPVINLPEAAILGVGRITPQWAYRPESPTAPVLLQMLTLSLVFDHRLVDGAPAARFLQHIKGLIEEPFLLLAA